jgi:hypothetical protein
MVSITSLAEGLGPIREWFDAESAFPRLIAIQSAT